MKLQSLAAENTIKIIAVHEAANNIIHQSYINILLHHLHDFTYIIQIILRFILNRRFGTRLRNGTSSKTYLCNLRADPSINKRIYSSQTNTFSCQ